MNIVIVGSKQWCNECASFYLRRAEKFSRMKYPDDDVQMLYALFMYQFWLTETPWA